MEFQDRILRCVDCGAEFVWTAGEQQFFADKNFKNEPKRCKTCKTKRASRPGGPRGRERVETVTKLLGLRQGNNGAVQADAGASGLLQRVLPVPEVRRGRRPLTLHRRSPPTTSTTIIPARGGSPAPRAGCAKLTRIHTFGAFSCRSRNGLSAT